MDRNHKNPQKFFETKYSEAEDGRAAVELTAELQPDLVLMDIMMPHLNGIEATRQIKKIHPNVKILALSVHANKKHLPWTS